MRERLPNAHYPVRGVLARSEESGPRQLNIKSQKRKARVHTKSVDYLKNGRTPFVVTSESPGPAEYILQPDFSFLPPPSPLTKPMKRKQIKELDNDAKVGVVETLAVSVDMSNAKLTTNIEVSKEETESNLGSKDDSIMCEKLSVDSGTVGMSQNEETGEESEEDEDSGWSSSDEVVEDIVIEEIDTVLQTKKWTKEELNELWSKYDNNNSGQVSFAEIEKAIIEFFPELDNKEVMRQAYKFADFDGSGLISKREFRTLLDALSFFQAQWLKFESVDRNGDLSMDIVEFVNDRSTLGLGNLSVRQAEDVFRLIDSDCNDKIRFFELCNYLSKQLEKSNTEASASTSASTDSRASAKKSIPSVKVQARDMVALGRLPGVNVPISKTGRQSFQKVFSRMETVETVQSPGPVYDISTDIKHKSHCVAKHATFGTGSRFGSQKKDIGPGPGKYNAREYSFQLQKAEGQGGAAVLKSNEPRTMLSNNSKRRWGSSMISGDDFFPPESDYFQRPSQHSTYANPITSIKSKDSPNVFSFGRSKKKSSYLPDVPIQDKSDSPSDASGVSRMDEPLSCSVLSTSLNAPSHSFGKGTKHEEKASLGPGPGAYSVATGKLTSIGDGNKLLLSKHGSPAFTFGGGSDGREAHPVVDRKKGVVYGPAAQIPMTKAEKREAALRGMGVVSKANMVPGVGTYDIDLSAKLDAALILTRQKTQFPKENSAIALQGSRSIALAAAQHAVSPTFSFASTGREDQSRVFSGSQFMNVGMFSPDTPGHFFKAFPAPTFQPEKHTSSQTYSMGGSDRSQSNIPPTFSDNFPDARLDILNSCGEKSSASPYRASPLFSIGKATRTAVAVNGIRTATMRVDKEAIYKDYRLKDGQHQAQEESTDEDEANQDSFKSHTPSFAKATSASKRVADRNMAGDSPGPDYYSTVASMHALDRGGVPNRQQGVKLTQARRFPAYRREDGTVVEHPFDAIQTQKLLNQQPEVKHPKTASKTINTQRNSQTKSERKKQ